MAFAIVLETKNTKTNLQSSLNSKNERTNVNNNKNILVAKTIDILLFERKNLPFGLLFYKNTFFKKFY